MIKWFHHLFNPHCMECRSEHECKTCDTLRQLLDAERRTNRDLLDSILGKNEVKQEVVREPIELKSRDVPWRVRQQMLEEEDRVKARILRDKEIERLENSVGINDASKISEAI